MGEYETLDSFKDTSYAKVAGGSAIVGLTAALYSDDSGVTTGEGAAISLELAVPGVSVGGYSCDTTFNQIVKDGVELITEQVAIDIKPSSDLNPINPMSSGLIPVALLGSATFDVREVDPASLMFGPAFAAPSREASEQYEDVDGDDFEDLVSSYVTGETGIVFGDEEGCLVGAFFDGTPLEGCDSVLVVGPSAVAAFSQERRSTSTRLRVPTTRGWSFLANTLLFVTDLGFWDGAPNGLARHHEVGLWTAEGELLVSARIPRGVDSERREAFRYVAIDPIELEAGQKYVIAATLDYGSDTNLRRADAVALEFDSDVTFEQGVRSINRPDLRFPRNAEPRKLNAILNANFRAEALEEER